MVYWRSKKFVRPLHSQRLKLVHYLYPFNSIAFPSKILIMKKGTFSHLVKVQFWVLLTLLISLSGCAAVPNLGSLPRCNQAFQDPNRLP